VPSTSQDQQQAFAIALHSPKKLFARNRSMLKMSHKQLHDFAATPRKGLPKHSPKEGAERGLSGQRKPRKNMGALSGSKD
jgi:hypothetical protein